MTTPLSAREEAGALLTAPAAERASRRGRMFAWARAITAGCISTHALPAVDGLRAIAASLVFVVHYNAAFGPLLSGTPVLRRAADYAADVGYHGVSVFFVLSGFLIYGSLVGKPVRLGHFVRRRVERIYPTFLTVLALYLMLGTVFRSRSKLPDTGLLRYLLANAALLPGVFPIRPIITVSWSLSYEVFFYLVLGASVVVLRLRAWRRRYRVALLVALFLVWLLGGRPVQDAARSFIMFLPGLLVWELWAARRARRASAPDALPRIEEPRADRPGGWLVWGAFAGLLALVPAVSNAALAERMTAAGLAPPGLAFVLLMAGVCPLLWQAVAGRRAAVVGVLAARPLRFLGAISYSFYLIHGLTINALALALEPVIQRAGGAGPALYLALFVPAYAAATVVAAALFTTVERRFSV